MSFSASIALDDKYTQARGRVLLSGVQALVRLPMMQRDRDRAAGLNTAGFLSGYRGSPLAGLDKELTRAAAHLQNADIRFQPGLNEDLAAAAVWGSQQVGLEPGARVDGVFAYWYGKGPGLDRAADAFKHANSAGTSAKGGVLVLAGDDHGARSSTMAHQSEQLFAALGMPVLNPAGVQELLDYGLIGWELSRWSGLWVGMKAITDTVESSAVVDVTPWRVQTVRPADFQLPPGGLSIRWPDKFLDQEERLLRWKLPAAQAFARANRLDRMVLGGPARRFGIVTAGKSYLDVMQALDDLGIDAEYAAAMGLCVYKIGMTWPLEPEGARRFCDGLEEVLVVEEKRPVIEDQLRALLYNQPAQSRPVLAGKTDDVGAPLLPSHGELTPSLLARVIAARIGRFYTSMRIRDRLDRLDDLQRSLAQAPAGFARIPYFCAGCPHNTSTNLPDGARAMGGIGCHIMATWMPERSTRTYTHMGGEGANWIGQAPFTAEKHVFQNLGDGTYYHSGILAVRACIAAGVNITYKILFNDAVAMTGGQSFDGPLDVPAIARQMRAEGVSRIAITSDRAIDYADRLPPGTTIHAREHIIEVQKELAGLPGVTVLIHDQTCAAEKRRRRKRGLMDDPDRRIFINQRVCEGCGDCGEKSNCVAVAPVETDFGRKRAIDQSACNKDFSCVQGFCPAFVELEGARLKTADLDAGQDFPAPPLPEARPLDHPCSILVAGIGGAGVVTIAQVLAMAAHLDGNAATSLDQTGLAQKNGAVISHVRMAGDPAQLFAARIADCGADVLLGFDLVTAASPDALCKMQAGRSVAVVDDHMSMTAAFTHEPDLHYPTNRLHQAVERSVDGACDFIDSAALAQNLLGDAVAANMLLLGFAWQKGLIPTSPAAMETAIELNGVAAELNKRAFLWGRRAACDRDAVLRAAGISAPAPAKSDAELIALFETELLKWGGPADSALWRARIDRVKALGDDALTLAAARSLFKLTAYKDEYETARLYSEPEFRESLAARFGGWSKISIHMAPPWLGARKRRFGPWMLTAMGVLRRFKFLRGTWADPFGRTAERRMERAMVAEFAAVLDRLAAGWSPERAAQAVAIAAMPMKIRGFGPIKAQAANAVRAEIAAALHEYEKAHAHA